MERKAVGRRAIVAAALSAPLLGRQAEAQANWPTKPIRIVVPFNPGGAIDALVRVVAEGLSKRLGQQVVVDPRPGAFRELSLEQVRDAADELHDIEPALDIAERVRNGLAVFRSQQARKRVAFAFDQFLEAKEHARAPLRIDRRPCRLRCLGNGNRGAEGCVVAEQDASLNFSGIGIENVTAARIGSRGHAAGQQGLNFAHPSLLYAARRFRRSDWHSAPVKTELRIEAHVV